MEIYKDKLPAGWSYGLRPAHLEKAIMAAAILLPVTLHQHHKVWAAMAPAFSGTFHPRDSYLGGEDGSVTVRSYAIAADQRKAAQDFAEGIFLPALIRWIAALEVLPANSTVRREEQYFSLEGSPFALNARTIGSEHKGQRRRTRPAYIETKANHAN